MGGIEIHEPLLPCHSVSHLSLRTLVEKCLCKICENFSLAIEAIIVLFALGELGQVV